MNGWKIVHGIHHEGKTAYLAVGEDGVGFIVHQSNSEADAYASAKGQRIVRHDDGTCTIEDLPKPKTALELIAEWREGAAAVGYDGYVSKLDAIAEAHRRDVEAARGGRAS